MRRNKKIHYFILMTIWMVCISAQAAPRTEVIIGAAAPELERFAASELCDYLVKLYGVQAFPRRSRILG